jgi:hypothetical protein
MYIATGYLIRISRSFQCERLSLKYSQFLKAIYIIQECSVSIARGYKLDGQGLIPTRSVIFLFSIVPRMALGPSHFLTMGTGVNFLTGKATRT